MISLTLDDLLEQLEQARQMAIEERKPTAMIQATITTAKLLGFDKPVVKDVNADAVQSISDLMNELSADYSKLSDNELRQMIAIEKKAQVTRVIVDPVTDTKERY